MNRHQAKSNAEASRDQLNIITSPKGSSTQNSYIHSVLLSFIPVFSIFFITFIINSVLGSDHIGLLFYLSIICFVFLVDNIVSYISLSSIVDFGIYWRSSLLTNAFLIGYMITNQSVYPTMVCFGYYLMSLSFFHLSEFVTTALFNQSEVSTDSFLINHSWEYGLAMLVSWCEFFIELAVCPSIKTNLYLRFFGLVLVMGGEVFRKLAMYTCGK